MDIRTVNNRPAESGGLSPRVEGYLHGGYMGSKIVPYFDDQMGFLKDGICERRWDFSKKMGFFKEDGMDF